ncbi:MAG: uroporphyrinogen decarboxylase family protein [Chloroflexi bacterium]|nr:uroporphyrinogen decarboxylase family protein [Chloroflexota bacterium]MDA8188748.1 uroporphyrinogen decarboxylase family protein [Dehalococcoidales bacterium]
MAASKKEMTSLERVSTALRPGIPDAVPVFLESSTLGAREVGLSLPEYYRRAENVAEGQLRFAERFGSDSVSSFFYAGRDAEAFGAEVIFRESGPPNMGTPIISDLAAIDSLEAPDPARATPLQEVLRCTRILADRSRGRWPVVGQIIGPLSLPILLMGLGPWMELVLFGDRARRNRLIRVTSKFCVAWANALLAAGVDIIALDEPMASSAMLTREQAVRLVLPIVQRVVRRIQGQVIYWSIGPIQQVADLIPDTGVRALSTDPKDDLRGVKRLVSGRIAVIGGLNDLAMLTWTRAEAEAAVREAIGSAASGGGFILSNQNDIPFSVEDEMLLAVAEAARKWGQYRNDAP